MAVEGILERWDCFLSIAYSREAIEWRNSSDTATKLACDEFTKRLKNTDLREKGEAVVQLLTPLVRIIRVADHKEGANGGKVLHALIQARAMLLRGDLKIRQWDEELPGHLLELLDKRIAYFYHPILAASYCCTPAYMKNALKELPEKCCRAFCSAPHAVGDAPLAAGERRCVARARQALSLS